jgi:hypothetical protein
MKKIWFAPEQVAFPIRRYEYPYLSVVLVLPFNTHP